LKGYYPEDDGYYSYVDLSDKASTTKALQDLEDFANLEGPFDIILGHSYATSIITAFLLQNERKKQSSPPLFKAAIFLAGLNCLDYEALAENSMSLLPGEAFGKYALTQQAHAYEEWEDISSAKPHMKSFDLGNINTRLSIPTANIWSTNDLRHAPFAPHLAALCSPSTTIIFMHNGEFSIPGGNDEVNLVGVTKIIRSMVDSFSETGNFEQTP
jgi:hypothetical protein